jgi:hypothetical protein
MARRSNLPLRVLGKTATTSTMFQKMHCLKNSYFNNIKTGLKD